MPLSENRTPVRLVDNNFAHLPNDIYPDAMPGRIGMGNDFFYWVSGEADCVVFTDVRLGDVSNLSGVVNIAWLVEPQAIHSSTYEFVSENLDRFDFVFTFDKEYIKVINSPSKAFYVPYGMPWVSGEKVGPKEKMVALIASNKDWTDGHRLRHDIAATHKGSLDCWGRAYGEFGSKEELLRSYCFEVVVENSKRAGYYTEKLTDAFLTKTVPIYWGDPDAGDAFNMDGVITFDKKDDLVGILSEATTGLYKSKIDAIEDNYNRAKAFISIEDVVWRYALSRILK